MTSGGVPVELEAKVLQLPNNLAVSKNQLGDPN